VDAGHRSEWEPNLSVNQLDLGKVLAFPKFEVRCHLGFGFWWDKMDTVSAEFGGGTIEGINANIQPRR
jgi:hypothetical protein